ELRVAATPDTVKKYVSLGAQVCIETEAGKGAAITDEAFHAAGATIAYESGSCTQDADIILKVRAPEKEELMLMPESALLLGMLDPYAQKESLSAYNLKKLSAFAIEL